jgi:hypothetical protein
VYLLYRAIEVYAAMPSSVLIVTSPLHLHLYGGMSGWVREYLRSYRGVWSHALLPAHFRASTCGGIHSCLSVLSPQRGEEHQQHYIQEARRMRRGAVT